MNILLGELSDSILFLGGVNSFSSNDYSQNSLQSILSYGSVTWEKKSERM